MGLVDRMALRALDSSFNATLVLESYSSAIWTEKFNEVGDFEIHGPLCDELQQLRKNEYVYNAATKSLMVIEESGSEAEEDGDTMTITGRAMSSILDRRIIRKPWTIINPANPSIAQIVCDIVKAQFDNTNTGADAPRYWDLLDVANMSTDDTKVLGTNIALQISLGDNLLDVVMGLCQAYDLGFKCTFSITDKRTKFVVYDGVKRPDVIFSREFDNLLTSKASQDKKPYKNALLVVGNLEDTNSKQPKFPQWAGSSSGVTGLARREAFIKADQDNITHNSNGTESTMTDANYIAALQKIGARSLKNLDYRIVRSFEGEIIERAGFIYGTNFGLGDVVTVRFPYFTNGTSTTARLVGITLSDDTIEGKTFEPEFRYDL